MTLAELAQACNGSLVSDYADVEINGVSTDTRTIKPGNLFVALKGDRYDGNDHLATAYAAGAAACITSRRENLAAQHAKIVVEDTLRALQHVAHAWRLRHQLKVIAVTGSNGKSTVKEMIAAILVEHCENTEDAVLATRGNLNNHIGVPLMLCELSSSHRYAVLEAGMNHFGEISLLSRLIAPQVALINNAGPAHLEGVGSLEGVARAKAEIFEGLDESGVAVINGDDPFADYWTEQLGEKRAVRFGRKLGSEVRGEWSDARENAALRIIFKNDEAEAAIPVPGDHNRMNALAASAATLAVGVPLATVARGVANYKPMAGRQTVRAGRNGITIIDDTYNANLASICAGMNTLALRSGKRIVVLGHIAEQGSHSEVMHRAVGKAFHASDLDLLYATGEPMRFAVEEAGPRARWFTSKSELISALEAEIAPQVSVLVKGARSAAMEDVVAALMDSSLTMEEH
jgi:UDP-N-acetylmuramoyl-tripeptide--D-alanyl-D-alanine ligase